MVQQTIAAARHNIAQQFDRTLLIQQPAQLNEHIATTYSALRRGMSILSWSFPFALWAFGTVFGIGLLGSMSAFYYQPDHRSSLDPWPALWLLPMGIAVYIIYKFPYFMLFKRVNKNGIRLHSSSNDENLTGSKQITRTFVRIIIGSACYIIGLWLLDRSGALQVMYNNSPMRTVFIGFLCATGAFLFLYNGFTKLENTLLNLAGIGAILVALFPTTNPRCNGHDPGRFIPFNSIQRADPSLCPSFELDAFSAFGLKLAWHGVFAGIFFLGGALAIFLCSHDTLRMTNHDNSTKKWYTRLSDHIRFMLLDSPKVWYTRFYWMAGVTMLASPVAAWIVYLASGQNGHRIFIIETVGMLAFAAYWWVKSDEIRQTTLEQEEKSSLVDGND